MSDQILDYFEAKWGELNDTCHCDVMDDCAGECPNCKEAFMLRQLLSGYRNAKAARKATADTLWALAEGEFDGLSVVSEDYQGAVDDIVKKLNTRTPPPAVTELVGRLEELLQVEYVDEGYPRGEVCPWCGWEKPTDDEMTAHDDDCAHALASAVLSKHKLEGS